MSTKTTVAAECQIFLIIGGVLGSLLVTIFPVPCRDVLVTIFNQHVKVFW
jgi:hypothetical protein